VTAFLSWPQASLYSVARRRRPTLAAIRDNPTLHPRAFALAQERFPGMRWHFYADSKDSSQAFALSAFLPALEFGDKDAILDAFVTRSLPAAPGSPDRSWELTPEYKSPQLLWESGKGETTTIDILLVADDAVICLESKFRVDARQGWGTCSQPPRLCEGFHGRGSDRKGTSVACRLEAPDGDRGPRPYWRLARGYFREEVLAEQIPPAICPFRDDYQLMRNFLFAARYAEQAGRPYFGVIGIAPRGKASALAIGVERFKDELLLAPAAERVAIAYYEDYVALLGSRSNEARDLAGFLAPLLR
jgi:hypothetical protein